MYSSLHNTGRSPLPAQRLPSGPRKSSSISIPPTDAPTGPKKGKLESLPLHLQTATLAPPIDAPVGPKKYVDYANNKANDARYNKTAGTGAGFRRQSDVPSNTSKDTSAASNNHTVVAGPNQWGKRGGDANSRIGGAEKSSAPVIVAPSGPKNIYNNQL